MVFFVNILNLKIFARVLKCKTLQTQGVQEVIKSINRAKIQVRILRFKFLALPMTFYLTLNKSLSLDFPISKVIIFSLLLTHENSGRLSLRKLKKIIIWATQEDYFLWINPRRYHLKGSHSRMPWGYESTSWIKEQFKNEIPCRKMNTSMIITFRCLGREAMWLNFMNLQVIELHCISFWVILLIIFPLNHNERKSG